VWKIIESLASARKSDNYIVKKLYEQKHMSMLDPMDFIEKIELKGDVYLDVGCGNGTLTTKAAAHFGAKKVYGTDIRVLETDEFTFLRPGECSIPLGDNSVDIATMFSSFHHIKDPEIISEIKRILKPDGHLIIYDADISGEIVELMRMLHVFADGCSDEVYFRKLHDIDKLVGMVPGKKYGNEFFFIKSWGMARKKHFRLLTDKIPRLKYQRRVTDRKTVLHWGQRKLLMGEIEFLHRFYKTKPTKKVYMIYAGAAAGTHLVILRELFPEVYFELYDSNPFSGKLKKLDRVKIYNRYFFDSDAEKWKSVDHPDKHILLVSDIRTADTNTMSAEKVEKCVKADHKMQKNWYDIMEPDYSMFKFRLPWEDGKTKYMQGRIYIQCWAPVTSTETRLMVKKNSKLVMYDNRDYEERLFHFNVHEREMEYSNSLEGQSKEAKEGLDNRYDSVAEIRILENVVDDVVKWSKRISRVLGKRTLMNDNPLKKERGLVIEMKKLGMVPEWAPLTQSTYNKYVIPKWDELVKRGLVEKIDDIFIRS